MKKSIKKYLTEMTTKCFLCNGKITQNRYNKQADGLIDEKICFKCLRKKLIK